MLAPRYIQTELKCINPLYFAVFDPMPKVRVDDTKLEAYTDEQIARMARLPLLIDRDGRWKIRKWKSIHPINHKFDCWRVNSENILTVYEADSQDRDMGYMPLDMRTIHGMKMGFYWARNAKKLLEQVDRANDDMTRKEEEELEYQFRAAAKSIWRNARELMIDMGG